MANPYIAQQRAQFASDLANPTIRDQVCAMMITEDAAHPEPCLESLFNRILYCNSRGQNRNILSMLHSGFYGPYNRGMYPRVIDQLHHNPPLQARMNAAIATVMAGSDLIDGFTDQGLPTDPNGQRQPQLHLGGNIFNDWGGGPGGHDGAEAWRQSFEAAASKAGPAFGVAHDEIIQSEAAGHDAAWMKLSVMDFQKTHGLDPDGDVGPLTWTAVEAAVKGAQT